MNNNNLQIKNKTSYDKSNNLWIQDPFLRKEKAIELPSYSEKVVYDHGLSTHLFDRNQGIYAYQKKGIVNTKQKNSLHFSKKNNTRKLLVKSLPCGWKLSLKKISKWFD